MNIFALCEHFFKWKASVVPMCKYKNYLICITYRLFPGIKTIPGQALGMAVSQQDFQLQMLAAHLTSPSEHDFRCFPS